MADDERNEYDVEDDVDEDDPLGGILLEGNAENESLDKEVKNKQNHLLDLENELEENTNRVISMSEHLKNVQQEASQTKSLGDAKHREVESIKHQSAVKLREEARLQQEVKKTQQQVAELNEELNLKQNMIFKGEQKIESIKKQMNWGKQQLDDWIAAARQREEDTDVLNKYKSADDARTKELQIELEKETLADQQDQKLLDKEVTETHSHELGLDKVGILFNKIHKEKQELIARWEKTLDSMQGRDQEIQQKAETFQQLKSETNEKIRSLGEQEALLAEENTANEDTERKLHARERDLDNAQQKKNRLVEELQRFESELDAVRNTVHRTEINERTKHGEVEQLHHASEDWRAKIEEVQKGIEIRTAEVGKARKATLSAEEQTQQLDSMMDAENAKEDDRHLKLERAQAKAAKQSQSLYDLRHKEETQGAEITASQAMIGNMKSKLRALEKQQLEEQQLLYKQDFEIASLERRLARMQGDSSEKEDEEMKARIMELKGMLENHEGAESLLKTQLQKLEDELRLTRKRNAKDKSAFAVLQEKLDELQLEIRRSEDDSKKINASKEDLMVNENILKLEIRRMRKQLNRRADEVFTLEQQELQLKAAMEERMAEIAIHVELLRTQLKSAKDARSVVTKELAERVARIDQLRKRHEIIIFSTAPPDDGEKKSQAYLLVQAAQEREELQSLGDTLDTKIRKGEKEVRQLENVLFKMQGKNHKFRKSLLAVDGDDADAQQKDKLEMQLRTAMDRFRHKRRERNLLQEECARINDNMMQLQHALDQRERAAAETEAHIANLDEELVEQKLKRDRATTFAMKVVKLYRSEANDPESETAVELDFKQKQAKQFNASIMDLFDKLVKQHPSIAPEVAMLYRQAGLKRPTESRPGMRGGSQSSASTVSRSSSRSKVRSVAGRGGTMPKSSAAAAQRAQAQRGVTPKTVTLGLGL